MSSPSKLRFSLFIFALVTVMCLSAEARAEVSLSGTVLNSEGNPVSGARVMAVGRSDNSEHEDITDSRGKFHVSLKKAAYDLGVLADGYVTYYIGPVVVDGETRQDVSLRLSEGLSSDSIFGTIRDEDGDVLAEATISIHPNEGAPADFPQGLSAATNRNGTFSLGNVPESYLDLVVTGKGVEQTEYIDIVKGAGPCQVDFRVNTRWPNEVIAGMEADLSSTGDSAISSSVDVMSGSCSLGLPAGIPVNSPWYLVSGCGACAIKGGSSGIQGEINCEDTSPIRCWEIKVGNDGSWWYDYAVHTWNNCFIGNLTSISYKFTDVTQDTYSLWVAKQGEHKVNYDSKNPTIIGVQYTYTE